jgi:hypothetical protein
VRLIFNLIVVLNIVLSMWIDKKLYTKRLRLTLTVLAILVIVFDSVLYYFQLPERLAVVLNILLPITFVCFLIVTGYVIKVSWKKKDENSYIS